jgi:AcrR family transcriptional regulator
MAREREDYGDADPGRANYHHGELPATIMSLALEHIEAAGTEKLSLRALARQAGVSATAPYRHFPTKNCLIAALATQGFEKLGCRTKAIVEQDLPLEDKFIAMGLGYIEFAMENPTAYQLMFGAVLADFSEYAMLHNAATQSYDVVLELLSALTEEKGLKVDLDMFGGVVWSSVHGIASLLINNTNMGHTSPMRSLEAVRGDPEAALRLMFGHLLQAP